MPSPKRRKIDHAHATDSDIDSNDLSEFDHPFRNVGLHKIKQLESLTDEDRRRSAAIAKETCSQPLEQINSKPSKPYHSSLRRDPARHLLKSSIEHPSLQGYVASDRSRRMKVMAMGDHPDHHNPAPSGSSSKSDHVADNDPAALQREYATLGRQLTSLRQSLDTAQQALKIRTAEQDAQTQALIAKWKGVVREAAEDLFDAAKESFKSQNTDNRQPQEREFSAWEEEDRNELTEDQRDMLDVHEAEAKAQAEKYGLLEPPGSPDEGSSVSALSISFHKSPLIHRVADIHYGHDVAADEP